MNAIWPWIVVALAVATIGSARTTAHRTVTSLNWVLLALGFVFLQWGEPSLAAAVSIAAIGGLAAIRGSSTDPVRRLRIAGFAAVVPLAIVVAALVCVRDTATPWGGQLVLFAAGWAALTASLASFCAAVGASRRPVSASVGIAVLGAAAAILVAGSGRSSLPDAFYGFGLRTADEPLMWVLGPMPGFESGMRLSVAVPVPEVQWVVMVLAGLGLLAALAVLVGKQRAAGRLLGLATLGAGGMLAGLQAVVGTLKMPAGDAYADEVKRRLLAEGGQRVVDTGAFNGTEKITVAMADLGPEVVGLTFILLVCVAAFLAYRRDEAPSEPATDLGFSRDYLARGVAFLWVAWFVFLIFHDGFLGSPGMGSPGEWVFTGIALLATGLLIASWSPGEGRAAEAVQDIRGGLILAALLVGAGLAWRFGALLGLSLGVFQ